MRNKPRIRFKGFTEDWEQRELSSLTEYISTGKSRFVIKEFGEYAILGSTNVIGYDDAYDYDGNFILTARVGANAGQLYRYSGKVKITDNTVFLMSDRSQFIYYALTHFDLRRLSFGTGQPLVKSSELQKLKLCVPVSKSEQEKIGEIFNNIDNIITLHQRKLEKLKLAKKALLQKLFPKNGSQFPEIRFKGFTDAWEQRKLIDIAKTFIGLVTTMTENYRDSGTLLIRNSDIKEGQFVFSENPIHLDEEFAEKNKTRRLQIGDVVTVHTGDIGTSAVIEEKEAGAIGFATINTRTDKSILNPYFLATYFNTEKHKCYANSVSTGDGRSNYNIKDFNKLVISVPTLDEQERISVLINDMNTIITLHQRKLDKLQDMKKGLLQKMFV